MFRHCLALVFFLFNFLLSPSNPSNPLEVLRLSSWYQANLENGNAFFSEDDFKKIINFVSSSDCSGEMVLLDFEQNFSLSITLILDFFNVRKNCKSFCILNKIFNEIIKDNKVESFNLIFLKHFLEQSIIIDASNDREVCVEIIDSNLNKIVCESKSRLLYVECAIYFELQEMNKGFKQSFLELELFKDVLPASIKHLQYLAVSILSLSAAVFCATIYFIYKVSDNNFVLNESVSNPINLILWGVIVPFAGIIVFMHKIFQHNVAKYYNENIDNIEKNFYENVEDPQIFFISKNNDFVISVKKIRLLLVFAYFLEKNINHSGFSILKRVSLNKGLPEKILLDLDKSDEEVALKCFVDFVAKLKLSDLFCCFK